MTEPIITLSRKHDFDRVFKTGKRFRDRLLSTFVYRRDDDERPRAAFRVSKRVDKRAAVRNLVRRRLKEIWRQEISSIRDGIDVVFIARPPIAHAKYSEIAEVVYCHLRKAEVLDLPRDAQK